MSANYCYINRYLLPEGNQRTESQVSEETYQYDKRGNLTEIYKDGALINQYHFGALNRLESAMNYKTGLGAAYTYDRLGNWMGKVEGTPVEPLLPDAKLTGMNLNPTKQIEDVLDRTKQYHNLLQRNEDEKVISFTWDHNVLSATDADETYHYFQDDLGSPIRLLNETGEEQEWYGYDEFGQELYGNQKIIQPFGFTGYQKDQVTETYFAQARGYQAEQGRFVGEDIVKGNGTYPLTLNPYIYCWNQPIDLVDINGKWPSLSEIQEWISDDVIGVDTILYERKTGMGNFQAKGHTGGNIIVIEKDLEDNISEVSVNLEVNIPKTNLGSGLSITIDDTGIKVDSNNNFTNSDKGYTVNAGLFADKVGWGYGVNMEGDVSNMPKGIPDNVLVDDYGTILWSLENENHIKIWENMGIDLAKVFLWWTGTSIFGAMPIVDKADIPVIVKLFKELKDLLQGVLGTNMISKCDVGD